jgi:hypothetical protein
MLYGITAIQQVGSDESSHAVEPAALSGPFDAPWKFLDR